MISPAGDNKERVFETVSPDGGDGKIFFLNFFRSAMLTISAGRSVRSLYMEADQQYTITVVKQAQLERKDVLLGVVESSYDDLVVLRTSGTSAPKSTLFPDGDPLLFLPTDGMLRRLGAPIGKYTWTFVFTSYIPDNVGCYLGKIMDSGASDRVHVTLHKNSTNDSLANEDPRYKELVYNYYKVRPMKRLSSVTFGVGDKQRVFNDKGVFRALEIWTQTHAQGLAEMTDRVSKTGTNRVEKKYRVQNVQCRSAIAFLEALEPLISRIFVVDMTKDSDKYPEIAKLDDSFFQ